MLNKCLLSVTLVLILANIPVYAGSKDGNRLLHACSAITQKNCDCEEDRYARFNSGYCFGQMHAVMDLFADNHAYTQQLFCLPENGSLGQYARVIVKYLQANPEELHLDGSLLAINALRQAFPCKGFDK